MPAVYCGEEIFDEHAQVVHATTDVSDHIVAQIRRLVRRLVDRAGLCLRQYTKHPNQVVDLEHQALQLVMLIAQQRAMPLQGFARDGSDSRHLMDEEHQNPPRIVWHAIRLLFFEVRDDSEPMPVKPGGHFDHVEPARVEKERALAPFVRDEVLLPTTIRHEQCKCRVVRVGNGQVKRLHTKVELVGLARDAHEPGLGYPMYPRDYTLIPPVIFFSPSEDVPGIVSRQSGTRASIALANVLKIVSPVCRSCTGMDRRWKSCKVDLW
jgi:hypothetical protein